MIPLSVPNLDAADRDAVAQTIDDNWVSTAGPQVGHFEAAIAGYTGREHAVALSSGTAALHLMLLAAGIRPGDLVLVPDLTFIAPVNAIRYVGAEPVFIDAEPGRWQMDDGLVESWLLENAEIHADHTVHKTSGKRVAAILAVHVLGYPAKMERFCALAKQFNLTLLEDAAESFGYFVGKQHVGHWSKAAALSFNGNKIITSGAGGALITNDEALAVRVRHLSKQAKSSPSEYLHDAIGYNYGMPAMNAALGLSQMQKIERFRARKQEIHAFYEEALKHIDRIRSVAALPASHNPNRWLYTLLGPKSRGLQNWLGQKGIQTRKLWAPMHQQPMHSGFEYVSRHQHSVALYENSLSLPSSTGITDAELQSVAETVREFYLHA